MSKPYILVDRFFSDASKMRSHFEDRFANSREARSDRFVWDWWHVPGQYTALRTPAYHYFPKKLYENFHTQLVWWGRRNLGCHDISPPWMSCYIDGCRQDLHGDLPHGPWAFVFSLTPWNKRQYRGGETMLLRDNVLSYWNSGAGQDGLERKDIFTEIPPLFNRLTVFDPRIPHGVNLVEGVRDPREGRLVIHGWFVQPRPFIEGPLSENEVAHVIRDLTGSLQKLFAQGMEIQGVLSLRLSVSVGGRITGVKKLTDSLRHPQRNKRLERALATHIQTFLKKVSFRTRKQSSTVTLPLIFER